MIRKPKVRIIREPGELAFHNKTQRGIQDLTKLLKPKIRGWIQYYGSISRRSLQPVFYYLQNRMIRWILNKYKSFKGSKVKAANGFENNEKVFSIWAIIGNWVAICSK